MIKCFACGEMGHYKSKCPKTKLKKATGKQSEKEADTVLMTMGEGDRPCDDIWIADSGALTHIINSEIGLYNMKNIHEPVKISDGKLVYAKKAGWLRVLYEDKETKNTEFVLENIQYIPGFWINLFSLMVAISRGCTISNEGQMIVI